MKANHALVSRSTRGTCAIRIDFGAICISWQLSKPTWLITAVASGSEKMSRPSVAGGDMAGLFSCFAKLRRKVRVREGRLYRRVVNQEPGLVIKVLLFSQGIRDYESLKRDRRARLDALQTMVAHSLTISRPKSAANSTIASCCLSDDPRSDAGAGLPIRERRLAGNLIEKVRQQ